MWKIESINVKAATDGFPRGVLETELPISSTDGKIKENGRGRDIGRHGCVIRKQRWRFNAENCTWNFPAFSGVYSRVIIISWDIMFYFNSAIIYIYINAEKKYIFIINNII